MSQPCEVGAHTYPIYHPEAQRGWVTCPRSYSQDSNPETTLQVYPKVDYLHRDSIAGRVPESWIGSCAVYKGISHSHCFTGPPTVFSYETVTLPGHRRRTSGQNPLDLTISGKWAWRTMLGSKGRARLASSTAEGGVALGTMLSTGQPSGFGVKHMWECL